MNISKKSDIFAVFLDFITQHFETPQLLFLPMFSSEFACKGGNLLILFHFGEKCAAHRSYFEGNTITVEASEIFKALQTLISGEKLGSLCLSASENPTRVPLADSLPNLLINSAVACPRSHTTFEFYLSSCSLLSSLLVLVTDLFHP